MRYPGAAFRTFTVTVWSCTCRSSHSPPASTAEGSSLSAATSTAHRSCTIFSRHSHDSFHFFQPLFTLNLQVMIHFVPYIGCRHHSKNDDILYGIFVILLNVIPRLNHFFENILIIIFLEESTTIVCRIHMHCLLTEAIEFICSSL